MNRWQLARQLEYKAKSATWTDSPNAVVLTGGAVISSRRVEDLYGEYSTPFAVVRAGTLEGDPNHPERYASGSFRVDVVAESWGDLAGRSAIVGSPLESQGRSGGRGVDEVIEPIHTALSRLDSDLGVLTQAVVSGVEEVKGANGVLLAVATIDITAFNLTRDRYYHPGLRLLAVGGVATYTISWALPPDRFDRLGVVVRLAVGSTAPATPTDGVSLPVANLATSWGPFGGASGTYSTSLFGAYDEQASTPAVANRYSAAVSATFTIT